MQLLAFFGLVQGIVAGAFTEILTPGRRSEELACLVPYRERFKAAFLRGDTR